MERCRLAVRTTGKGNVKLDEQDRLRLSVLGVPVLTCAAALPSVFRAAFGCQGERPARDKLSL